jgi:hypothetical protein
VCRIAYSVVFGLNTRYGLGMGESQYNLDMPGFGTHWSLPIGIRVSTVIICLDNCMEEHDLVPKAEDVCPYRGLYVSLSAERSTDMTL